MPGRRSGNGRCGGDGRDVAPGVGSPLLRLEGQEHPDPALRRGEEQEHRSVVPGPIITVVGGRITLVHVDVVDATLKRRAECVKNGVGIVMGGAGQHLDGAQQLGSVAERRLGQMLHLVGGDQLLPDKIKGQSTGRRRQRRESGGQRPQSVFERRVELVVDVVENLREILRLDVDGNLEGLTSRRHADHKVGRLAGGVGPLQLARGGMAGQNAVMGNGHDGSMKKETQIGERLSLARPPTLHERLPAR